MIIKEGIFLLNLHQQKVRDILVDEVGRVALEESHSLDVGFQPRLLQHVVEPAFAVHLAVSLDVAFFLLLRARHHV